MDIQEKAKKIKLLVLDVDGVLTDGRIIYGDGGDELKFFDCQDGLGLALLAEAGLSSILISAKKSKVIFRRAKDMKVSRVIFSGNKLQTFRTLLDKVNLKTEEVCFMGDDLLDLGIIKKAGLAVAVSNAASEVKEAAHMITKNAGGRGAVREVIEMILKAQGKWQAIVDRFAQ